MTEQTQTKTKCKCSLSMKTGKLVKMTMTKAILDKAIRVFSKKVTSDKNIRRKEG